MRRVTLPATDRIIRVAVLLAVVGMLLLLPILYQISALGVGLFMLGSLLLTVAIVTYVVAVVRELRRGEAL